MHFYLIILFIFNVRRDIRAELSTLTSVIRWRVTQYSCIKQRASVCDTQWTNQLFKIVSVLVGLFYMILVTLNKHTDHMTSIKCHLLKWSAWKTLVPGGLLSTGLSESCVTGKSITTTSVHLQKANKSWPNWPLGGTFSVAVCKLWDFTLVCAI